jgi:hypothetical protein
MFKIDLQWLAFSVNLETVDEWMKALAGSNYVGNSADHDLTLWFKEEPTEEIKGDIAAYWEALTPSSPEATGYQSADQIKASAATTKAAALLSATSKLSALGLTSGEIAAILGQ